MKAVTCTNAKLEVVDRPSPAPAKGQLLLDVLRCGADRTCMPACTVMNWPT